MTSYQSAILSELSRARFEDIEGNYDLELGPEPAPPPGVLRQALATSGARLGEAAAALAQSFAPLVRALLYSVAPRR
jgi:hypothetical protein